MVKLRCTLKTISPGVQEGECEIIGGGGRVLGKVRTKRAPSKYNLHMKECLNKVKGKGDRKTNFKNCAAEYSAKKKGR
jgi:hypothetical protein